MVLADYANFEIDEDANGNPILRDSASGIEVTFTEDVEISDAVAIAGALTADSADVADNLEAGSATIGGVSSPYAKDPHGNEAHDPDMVEDGDYPDLQIDGETVDSTDTINFIPE